MRYLQKILLLILIPVCSTCFAQSEKTIDSLTKKYQTCLDEGKNMLDCSKLFYRQMDSMLNVVYFKQYSKLDSANKIQLRNEQRLWLKSRDVFFKKTLNRFKQKYPGKSPFSSAYGAEDDAMIMHDENAEFVKERILILLKKTFN